MNENLSLKNENQDFWGLNTPKKLLNVTVSAWEMRRWTYAENSDDDVGKILIKKS